MGNLKYEQHHVFVRAAIKTRNGRFLVQGWLNGEEWLAYVTPTGWVERVIPTEDHDSELEYTESWENSWTIENVAMAFEVPSVDIKKTDEDEYPCLSNYKPGRRMERLVKKSYNYQVGF